MMEVYFSFVRKSHMKRYFNTDMVFLWVKDPGYFVLPSDSSADSGTHSQSPVWLYQPSHLHSSQQEGINKKTLSLSLRLHIT